jgi:GDP-mannose 6-dehydrogenase
MKVSVIGLDQIERTSAAPLVRLGHLLTAAAIDPHDQAKQESAEHAQPNDSVWTMPIDSRSGGRKFQGTADLQSAVLNTDVSLVCATAPANTNGSQNLRSLDRIFIQIGTALAKKNEYHLIVVQTPVLPGTVEGRFTLLLEQHSGRRAGTDFGICMSPAFSWDATGLEVPAHPPQLVIGELDARSGDTAQQLYNGLAIPIFRTSIQTAEMLNFVSSAFQAVKITFANEINNLCQSHGIDGHEVMEYCCLERALNVSSAYFQPGFTPGESLLLRDLRALLYRAKEQDVDCPLLSAVFPSHQRQISRAIELVEKTRRSKIAILGLLFRNAAPDLRDNAVLQLAQVLAGKGYRVRIFSENPNVLFTRDNRAQAMVSKLVSSSLHEVIQESEVVVIADHTLSLGDVHQLLSDKQILIDLTAAAPECISSNKCATASSAGNP